MKLELSDLECLLEGAREKQLRDSLEEIDALLGGRLNTVTVEIDPYINSYAESYSGYAWGKNKYRYDKGSYGNAKIWIAPQLFKIETEEPAPNELMPSFYSSKADKRIIYILMHEIAHAWDPMTPEVYLLYKLNKKGVGSYGRKSQREFFAESMCEFFISQGRTENTVSQKMAARYGWGTW